MADQPETPEQGANPRLPWVLFATSTAVALLAAAGFVYLIAQRTTGPGEVLHDFYQAAHDGDCDTTYGLLSDEARAEITPEDWCTSLRDGEPLPSTFEMEEVVLEGDVATVVVRHPDGSTAAWELERFERTWRLARQTEGGGGGPSRRPPETPAT